MKVRDSLVTRRCNRNIDISESGRRDVPANETEINTISPFPWHEKNCDDRSGTGVWAKGSILPPKNRCLVANCTSLRIFHVRWFVCWIRLAESFSFPRNYRASHTRRAAFLGRAPMRHRRQERNNHGKRRRGLIDKYGPKPRLTMRRMPMSTIPGSVPWLREHLFNIHFESRATFFPAFFFPPFFAFSLFFIRVAFVFFGSCFIRVDL